MGVLSNRIDRKDLKAGDHIYSWRKLYIYAHHGIYVGDGKVIHFTPGTGQEVGTGTSSEYPCPRCGSDQATPLVGVLCSCIDCFLMGGDPYLFEYSVSKIYFLTQAQSGTCTMAKSDPQSDVLHRAFYLLQNEFGADNFFRRNSEDFAIYCKTGLLISNDIGEGTIGNYCLADIGVCVSSKSRDVIEVPVETLVTLQKLYKKSQNQELDKGEKRNEENGKEIEDEDKNNNDNQELDKEEKEKETREEEKKKEIKDCSLYLRTGTSKFGLNCKFNHPARKKKQAGKEKKEEKETKLPERHGQPICEYYLRTGGCKFGNACKYNHPTEKNVVESPLCFNFMGLPIRPGTKECHFYMRDGECKYGTKCKFNHPEPTALEGSDPFTGLDDGFISLPSEPPLPPPRTLNEAFNMAEKAKAKGNAAFSAGQFHEAIRFFSEAIDLFPINYILYSNRSAANASIHKYTEALSDAKKTVEINPDWPKGYSRLGVAHVGLGSIDEAVAAYKKGLQLDPNNEALKSGLAYAATRSRDLPIGKF